MTASQRLTAKQWKAEVEKMIGWGAPVPVDEAAALIEDLASRYPDTRTSLAPREGQARRGDGHRPPG